MVAALHLIRAKLWWHANVLKVPLLWSLHFSYFAFGVGLMMIALSFYTSEIHFKDALHLITIGTIGMMILAMMTRVSLGHTGRTLNTPIYICCFCACAGGSYYSLHTPLNYWATLCLVDQCLAVVSGFFVIFNLLHTYINAPSC